MVVDDLPDSLNGEMWWLNRLFVHTSGPLSQGIDDKDGGEYDPLYSGQDT